MTGYRSHCHYCGAAYPAAQLTQAHRTCAAPPHGCGSVAWQNPVPIAVELLTVWDDTPGMADPLRLGVLLGQRGIQPKLGQWGLPGGFCEVTDRSYEAAATRERTEEVQFTEMRNVQQVRPHAQLLGSLPGDPGQILAFSAAPMMIGLSTLETFVPCGECPAVRVAWRTEQLCFESHTEALYRWHPGMRGWGG